MQTPNDWNELTKQKIKNFGGASLFRKYSLFQLKCLGCPEGRIYFSPANPKPEEFWDNENNVKEFLNHLQLDDFDQWNSLTKNHIEAYGGIKLLNKYSLYELKCLGFPDGKDEFDLESKPTSFWNDEKNVIEYLNSVRKKFKLKDVNDWNSLTQKHIRSFGGGTLFNKYSMYDLKCLGFPDGKDQFDSTRKSAGFWDVEQNVIQFLNELKDILQIKTFEDWNSLTKQQIDDHGGRTLFQRYSMYDLKCLACPEGKDFFDPAKKPAGFWTVEKNILTFLDEVKHILNLKTPSDWSRVSVKQLKILGGEGLTNKLSLNEIIQLQFPNCKIKPQSNGFRRASQRWLFIQIQKLFPQEEIIEDYFHSEISRKTGYAVQFDIFLINKNIAIEYHGAQHYEDIPSGFAPLELYKVRDEEKKRICSEFGIKLIIIPYWWNNTLDALKETLQKEIENLVF